MARSGLFPGDPPDSFVINMNTHTYAHTHCDSLSTDYLTHSLTHPTHPPTHPPDRDIRHHLRQIQDPHRGVPHRPGTGVHDMSARLLLPYHRDELVQCVHALCLHCVHLADDRIHYFQIQISSSRAKVSISSRSRGVSDLIDIFSTSPILPLILFSIPSRSRGVSDFPYIVPLHQCYP